MKLLVLVVPREARDDAEAALTRAGSIGFTEVAGVHGDGASGPRFGTRTAPGVSDLILVALPEERLEPVREALGAVERKLGRPLHAFLLPAEPAWP
ncbi:MAG TPA: hypothetical protein VFZ57_05365 [Thermoanaerobaculia bacterium]|nr:hypothetical protein [Thermoanaerobaculia bacterium]